MGSIDHLSKYVMISSEVFFYLFECIKVIEQGVFKNSVEFMFKACKNSSGLKRINTLLLKCLGPVECSKIKKFEVIDNK